MKRNTFVMLTITIALLCASLLLANDGKDRYAGAYANELYLFPDTPALMAGYRVLKKDGPGGADGDRTFRWAKAQAIAVVRVAAYEVYKTLGNGNHPMPIFDLSSENGDTPVNFHPVNPPRGRHPGGSHDGGINMDLGYYLTSLKGLYYTPDHSACSMHFKDLPKEKKGKQVKKNQPKDAYICRELPDRLDVLRQSYFMLKLLQMNRDLFQSNLLEQIGMDLQIINAVEKQFILWQEENQHCVCNRDIEDLRRICIADSFEGWSHAHHHHLHLRLRDISIHGKYGPAFQQLFKKERDMDRLLLAEDTDSDQAVLRARLFSYNKNRAIEAELLNQLPPGTKVRFRVGKGKWVKPDPSSWQRTRAMLELPLRITTAPYKLIVHAEISPPDSEKFYTHTSLIAPRLEPHLFVAVDPGKIRGNLRQDSEKWRVSLDVPSAYKPYITGFYMEIFKGDKTSSKMEKKSGSIIDYSYTFNPHLSPKPVKLIRAVLVLSSRMKLRFPIYCAPK